MRIAVFTSAISPYHDARYRAIVGQGCDVSIVSASDEGEFVEFLAKKRGTYSVTCLFRDRASYREAVQNHEIAAVTRACLEVVGPDAVAVAGWVNPEGLAALEWAREMGRPTILMSESQGDDATRSPLRELVKRLVVSNFDAALVGGPPHASYVSKLGIPPNRVHLGYNAVDNDHFSHHASLARLSEASSRARYSLPRRYILASARFIPKKNLPALVDGYAEAREHFADFPDLVILGDGALRAQLEKQVVGLGLAKSVHLPGFRGYDDLPAYYGLAEAFCHVSTTEQWGLVINEAMAAGVPVIVSAGCGAARTVVKNGESGFVIQPTKEDIAAALVELFSEPEKFRAAMGKRASKAIESWGPQRFGIGMAAALQSAQRLPRRGRLALLDRAILSWLQKQMVATVA